MKKSLGPQTIIHPCPVLIVGTYSEKGIPNMMNAAWGGICCSNPPCVAVSIRRERQTYENIMKNKSFTVNIPSIYYVKEADYVGIYSGKKKDKFAETKLTPIKSDLVNAPYVKEFPYSLECKLIKTVKLGSHTSFIGEILDIKADENVIGENGLPDIERVKPILYATANQGYYEIGQLLGNAFAVGKSK